MPKAHVVVAPVLLLAAALGVLSVLAIRRTASRRATLVDALSVRVPPIADARQLTPWQPVADADLVHMTLCFDGSDPAAAAARFAAALAATPWRFSAVMADAAHDRASVTAQDGTYRLRALAEPGRLKTCEGAERQVLVSVEAAPISRPADAATR